MPPNDIDVAIDQMRRGAARLVPESLLTFIAAELGANPALAELSRHSSPPVAISLAWTPCHPRIFIFLFVLTCRF
jgi:hypothetical protein